MYGELAGRYVARDSVWLALGAACLALLLLLLTRGSVVVVGATFLALGWSLTLAYGLYTRLLRVPTFPLLNMMALVLLLGLGADDILLFYQVGWSFSFPLLAHRNYFTTCSAIIVHVRCLGFHLRRHIGLAKYLCHSSRFSFEILVLGTLNTLFVPNITSVLR